MGHKLQYDLRKYGDGAHPGQQVSDGLYFPAAVWAKQAVSGCVVLAASANHAALCYALVV